MSSSAIPISVRGLGKSYTIAHEEKHTTLAEAGLHFLRNGFRSARRETFWALRGVTFDIHEGDVIGIVGANGAGKSTLLKIMSQITEPTEGEVHLHGRVGSLLEVGTGFHQELTGRENIYLNGAILGMRRAEITRRFDEIVAFSGVERFLDTPVKRFSSGMFVRLAFAVAAHLDTEILLVDEVLAVGDLAFQKKCLGKIGEVARTGRTVLFVSHNMATLESLCNHGILLESGRIVQTGSITDIIAAFHERLQPLDRGDEEKLSARFDFGNKYRYFRRMKLLDEEGNATSYMTMGREFRLRVDVESEEPVDHPIFCVMIDNIAGSRMLTVSSPNTHAAIPRLVGRGTFECRIPSLPLAPGDYAIKLGLWKGGDFLERIDPLFPFTVRNADTFGDGWGADRGVCISPSFWHLEQDDQALAAQ